MPHGQGSLQPPSFFGFGAGPIRGSKDPAGAACRHSLQVRKRGGGCEAGRGRQGEVSGEDQPFGFSRLMVAAEAVYDYITTPRTHKNA